MMYNLTVNVYKLQVKILQENINISFSGAAAKNFSAWENIYSRFICLLQLNRGFISEDFNNNSRFVVWFFDKTVLMGKSLLPINPVQKKRFLFEFYDAI